MSWRRERQHYIWLFSIRPYFHNIISPSHHHFLLTTGNWTELVFHLYLDVL
jgi:hypothetical protein